MPPARRTRRPLLARIALLVLLLVGYTVNALRDSGSGTDRGARSSTPSSTRPASASPTLPTPSRRTTIDPPRLPAPGAGAVALSALPPEAGRTVALIRSGGPFPYDRDGVVFGNLERRLPVQRRGYYREYTVATPGESDRGARRIITGGGGEYYYTADHYESFVAVDVTR